MKFEDKIVGYEIDVAMRASMVMKTKIRGRMMLVRKGAQL